MADWHGGAALLQCLLTALPESPKSVVFGELETSELELESVLECLQREYGGDAVLEQRDTLSAYRKCVRVSSEGLGEFLKRYRHARQAAILATVLVPNASTDTWDLLEACNLSSTQKGNILSQLQVRLSLQPEITEYDHVHQLLTNLARAFGPAQGQASALLAAPTPVSAVASAPTPTFEGKGKGSWQKGGWQKMKQGGWKKPGQKGSAKGGGKGDSKSKGGKGKGGGGKNGEKGGWKKDWRCECGAWCWGSKDVCFKCGKAKPEQAVGSGAPHSK